MSPEAMQRFKKYFYSSVYYYLKRKKMCHDRKPYGPPVDLWALGILLYIMLFGYSPFPTNELRRLCRHVIAGKFTFHPKYWTTISSEVKDLIEHLIVVNPHHRSSAQPFVAPAGGARRHGQQVSRDGPDRKSQAHEET